MERSGRTLLILLLLTTLFKGIVWAALTPIWHAPDEQAHFAQVQYYAEMKQGLVPGPDLSQEIYESERLLGTLRDERGINEFTYHPEYRIEYSETYTGVHEEALKNLPRSSRTTFVKKEAARYPPLFYILSSTGYLLGGPFSIFVRLAFTRMISVLLGVATVWVSFLLAKAIFPKKVLLSIAVASFVSFQPMFTFLSSGVNNDNLINLFSAILLWLMVDAMRKNLTTFHTLGMGITLGLGILTKQLIYPFIPLPLLVFVYSFLTKRKKSDLSVKHVVIFLFAGLLFGGGLFASKWIQSGKLPGWPQINITSTNANLALKTYLAEKIPRLYRETLPWYWGVFKWLGVVLPINILRVIKVVLGVSLIGLVRYSIKKIKEKKLSTRDWQLLFIIFSSIWFAFWLLFWDFSLVRSIGFSHGLQGRTFFTNLAGHMTLLVFGLWHLGKKYKTQTIKIAISLMVILNFIALKTLLGNYYDLTTALTFITQASQYKPWFFKGIWLIIWMVIYLTILINFLHRLFKFKRKKA